MLNYGCVIGYVDVFDLLFNGGKKCEILSQISDGDEYITITEKYDRPRDRYLIKYYYRGIYLGGQWDTPTSGILEEIMLGLRGKGVFQNWNIHRGATYRPFSTRDERIIKRLGLWVF